MRSLRVQPEWIDDPADDSPCRVRACVRLSHFSGLFAAAVTAGSHRHDECAYAAPSPSRLLDGLEEGAKELGLLGNRGVVHLAREVGHQSRVLLRQHAEPSRARTPSPTKAASSLRRVASAVAYAITSPWRLRAMHPDGRRTRTAPRP